MSRATYEKVNNSGHGAGLEVAESLGHISERLGFTAGSRIRRWMEVQTDVAAATEEICPKRRDMLRSKSGKHIFLKRAYWEESPELAVRRYHGQPTCDFWRVPSHGSTFLGTPSIKLPEPPRPPQEPPRPSLYSIGMNEKF